MSSGTLFVSLCDIVASVSSGRSGYRLWSNYSLFILISIVLYKESRKESAYSSSSPSSVEGPDLFAGTILEEAIETFKFFQENCKSFVEYRNEDGPNKIQE